MPRVAQASPSLGHGGFVNLGAAAQLEGRDGGPLRVEGATRAVEAGWLIPGGTIFLFELGLRGAVMAERAEAAHELGLFGGARIDLLRRPLFSLMPYFRGGLAVALIRVDERRLGFGPYLGAGVALEIFDGVTLALEANAQTRIAPFSLALGGSLAILVQGF